MESALVNFWKFIVVFALLLVFINPIIYIFGLFSWLVASMLNLFSYLGASCSAIESISQVIVGVIFGWFILKIYWIFNRNT